MSFQDVGYCYPLHFKSGKKKGTKRVHKILAMKQGGEILREQGDVWVMPLSSIPPVLAQLWVDSQVRNAAGDV